MPVMRVRREWGLPLLDEKTQVVCDNALCMKWLDGFLSQSSLWARAQDIVVRSFGLPETSFGSIWSLLARRMTVNFAV